MLPPFLEELCIRISAFWNNMRYRRLSIRPLTFIATAIFILLTVYYVILPRDSFSFRIPGFSITAGPTTKAEWAERADIVKKAFLHAYHGYEKYALPHDELTPLTNESSDKFNGWGVTLYDSLDTMYLMGLQDEFQRALHVIEKATFPLKEGTFAPFFETVIRYLGGLLSAYALSRERILLTKADELARLLSPVFTTPSGLPCFEVNTVNGVPRGPDNGYLAEVASFQVEYTYLAQASGNKDHYDKAARVIQVLANADLSSVGGMFPVDWNLTTGQPHDRIMSVGAAADSAHEYLLKQYLLTGKKDKVNLEMYLRFTTYMLSRLVYISPHRNLIYVTDIDLKRGYPSRRLEHLSCFLPGLLALGAHTLPLDDLPSLGIDYLQLAEGLDYQTRQDYLRLAKYNLTELHMWAAKGLAETCYMTYIDQPSGLGPDETLFHQLGGLWMDHVDKWRNSGRIGGSPPGLEDNKKPIVVNEQERYQGTTKTRQREYGVRKKVYLLRPETIESLYLLWRVTGEVRWREYGWTIFKAIESQTKTFSGYASVSTVEQSTSVRTDEMPSYFMAETLKYLYLMFLEEDPISLHEWVFNSEAHPLPVIHWTEEEKLKFGINY